MKLIGILSITALFSLLMSCGETKNVATTEQPATEEVPTSFFIIGEGGGFTGAYEQYKVLENGQVKVWNGEDESTAPLGTLPEKEVSELFQSIQKLNFEGLPFKPGNMNYSINLVTSEGAQIIQWSDQNFPDVEVVSFYKTTMNLIRDLK